MFTKRLVSGIILIFFAIIIVGSGGPLLYVTTGLISLIGLFELYRVMKIEKNPPTIKAMTLEKEMVTEMLGALRATKATPKTISPMPPSWKNSAHIWKKGFNGFIKMRLSSPLWMSQPP